MDVASIIFLHPRTDLSWILVLVLVLSTGWLSLAKYEEDLGSFYLRERQSGLGDPRSAFLFGIGVLDLLIF